LSSLISTYKLITDEDTDFPDLDINLEEPIVEEIKVPETDSRHLRENTLPEFPGINGAGVSQTDVESLAIQSGQLSPNLFAGSANYVYPIQVIPGINNLVPDISIQYSHLSTNVQQSELGTAWSLNTPIIYRDINYTRSNTEDDFFRINFNGVSSKLILGEDNKYHTEIESYLSIEKLTCGSNTWGEYWLVRTKEGNRFYFGNTENSELVSNLEDYTVKWSLSKIQDTHGNEINYNYVESPNNEQGTVYLDSIQYNNNLDIVDILQGLLQNDEFKKVLVFGRTRRGVENLSRALTQRGLKTESIHSDKTQAQRKRALLNFRNNRVQTLVATDVAARGLDINNITHVINYEIPETYDDYIHRIGRTGRGTQRGKALTFVN